ncbi:MAG TPA: hypothetical protein PLQ39_08280 [Acinetobacter sp.]|nr:hypothetical protein [Acinetobacter sp.]
MPHELVLHHLQQQGRICRIDAVQKAQRLAQEQHSLVRLQQRESSYLNVYDQLFRLVSIWLLQQGYDLTNFQPHQVLKMVCRVHFSTLAIESMVQHRHELKKGQTQAVSKAAWADLQHCYQYFSQLLQACD